MFSLDTMITLLAALFLAGPIGVQAQTSAFRMDIVHLLMNSMLDPIVSPNQVSQHMHKIVGGSRFRSAYNYDDLLSSQCTTAALQADKSAYWMPSMYVYDSAKKTYQSTVANIRFYYFLPRTGSNATDPQPFPKGLRILTGNPYNKSPVDYARFYCQTNPQFTNNIPGDSFNFDRACPNGIKVDLMFPGCWNGRDLYAADGSHMSYTTRGVRDGACPLSHPIRVPTLQMEYTYQPNLILGNNATLKGKLMWANGDTTGYGVHGDFINGWETKVLADIINDPYCGRSGGAVGLADCKNFAQYWQPDVAKNCKSEFGELSSSIAGENKDMVALQQIPGCNPPWTDGAKPNAPCSGATYDLNSNLQGWDGPLIADFDDRRDQSLPTRGGWQDIYCVPDTAIKREYQYRDNAGMTKTQCQNRCQKIGYSYAAIGQLGAGEFMCYCGNSFDQGASRLGKETCSTKCPGNAAETCGGARYQFTLSYAPPGTPLAADPQLADGSSYVGCYAEGASPQLSDVMTYKELSYTSMTTAYCKSACAKLGNKWAAVKGGRECYCGQEFKYGAGGFVADTSCGVACNGNTTEMCGGYYQASLFNITTLNPSLGAVKRLDGYQGCFPQKSGSPALNKATWTRDDVTPISCINGCSELGYKLAGLQGKTCSCGDTSSAGSKIADSNCNTACSGDKTQICGGSEAVDIYTMAASNTTAGAIAAGKSLPDYAGCFVDSTASPAMKSPYTVTNDKLTGSTCARSCAQYGYKYAGLVGGNTCKCSNDLPTSERVQASRFCTTACKGNATETCGGNAYMDAFDISKFVATDPTVYKPTGWVGCYSNSASSLTLEKIAFQSSPLTAATCRTACANQGYTYAGTGNSNTCYCGNSLSKGTKGTMTSCNQPCAENTGETCGAGTSFIDVYTTSGSGAYSSAAGYAGCFNDDNTLNSFQISLSYQSAEICSAQCAGRGFLFAGMRNNLCKCGTKVPSNNIASSGCTTPCSADNKQMCGGSSSISVYDLAKAGKTTDIQYFKWNSTGFGGCFYEGGKRMLTGLFKYDAQLTVAKCIGYCKDGGFALAGAEYGTECYCGNKLEWSNGYQLRDEQCSTNCAGGGGKCGAPYSFSLYAVDPKKLGIDASAPSAAPASSSAPASTSRAASASSAAATTSRAASASSAAATTSRAASASSAAATTSRAASASSAAATTSRAASASSPPRNEGASASDATLPTTTTSSAPASTTTAAFTAGCYATDASFEKMAIVSTKMTQQICSDWCGLQGFAYAALYKGNTCQCGSDAYLLKPGSGCTVPCTGATRTTCGGNNSIYVRESTTRASECKRDFEENEQMSFGVEEPEFEGSVLMPNEREVRYPRRGAQGRARGHSLRRFW